MKKSSAGRKFDAARIAHEALKSQNIKVNLPSRRVRVMDPLQVPDNISTFPHKNVTQAHTNTAAKHPNTAAPRQNTAAPRSMQFPNATPGPSSLAPIRRPITTTDLNLLLKFDEEDEKWRSFKEMDEDESESDNYDPRSKGKGKRVETNKRKRDSTEDSLASSTVEEYSDDDDHKHKKINTGIPKSTPRTSTVNRSKPIPTGEYHEKKCSKCRLSSRDCEKQLAGGACFACRRYKHKCEYAKPRRQLKSRPVVESEDDEFISETPSRHPRQAAKLARRAIRKAVAASSQDVVPQETMPQDVMPRDLRPRNAKPQDKKSGTSSAFIFFLLLIFANCFYQRMMIYII